jgi:hypothetical protein
MAEREGHVPMMAAMRSGDFPDPMTAFHWQDARDAIVPLLARRPPGPAGALVTVRLDPGIDVGFGVDLGPMFVHVTAQLLRGWPIDEAALTRQAIGNLRQRAGSIPPDAAVRTRLGLVPLAALQTTDGWASSLLLAPDLLPHWFGPAPRIFIAPARNLLIGLPGDTDARLVRSVLREIGHELPDALDVPPLAWDGARLRRAAERTVEIAADEPPAGGGLRAREHVRPRPHRPAPARRWAPPRQGAGTTWYTPPPDRSVT